MRSPRKLVDFSVSVVILVGFLAVLALIGGYSTGIIDFSSEPTVNAEENTTGVLRVSASDHQEFDGVQMEDRIFELVNEKRTEGGEDPFVLSERVRLIARLHSKDMADRGYFNHTNPEGEGSGKRHQEYDGCNITNENIAKWESPPTSNESELARDIVDGWSNSPGHNTTMMSEYYKVAGVGVYVTENRSVYATMNFCREHPNA